MQLGPSDQELSPHPDKAAIYNRFSIRPTPAVPLYLTPKIAMRDDYRQQVKRRDKIVPGLDVATTILRKVHVPLQNPSG
jgi:hypothetical protein